MSMNIFKELKRNINEDRFNERYNKALKAGQIKFFDGEFYSQFFGMYFNGLPIYYYLEKMSMGKCYDASAILALAMGDGVYVCRGELETMSKINGEEFGHGWVETLDKVYDTTWKIILDKDLYYKIFGAKIDNRRTAQKFFEDCKEIADWKIHTKEYYEKEHHFANMLAFQVHQIAELNIKNPANEAEKRFYQQLRKDLPDFEKLKLMPDMFSIPQPEEMGE